jgi:Peptidase family M23/PA14 domain
LSIRGPRRFPRASIIAVLAMALVAPGSVLAGAPGTSDVITAATAKQQPILEPRTQHPGDIPGFRLPFAAGMDVRIEQGWNTPYSHNGKAAYAYDFGLVLDTPVLAAADGVVAYVHDGETACGGAELLLDANYVTINHADGSATQYGHLTSVGVKVGDVVTAGQEIGRSGDTGYTGCMPHLHFARQYQGGPVTQSVPAYFIGYADREFHSGDVIAAPGPACVAPRADGAVAGESLLGGFCGSYFGGSFDGPATFTRQDRSLNFDWRTHGPGGYWLEDANLGFSARWSGRFVFASVGTYTIGVIASGAVIVSIDGAQVVNGWIDGGEPIEIAPRQWLQAGVHQVDVDYRSTDGHGMLKVDWHLLRAPWFADR